MWNSSLYIKPYIKGISFIDENLEKEINCFYDSMKNDDIVYNKNNNYFIKKQKKTDPYWFKVIGFNDMDELKKYYSGIKLPDRFFNAYNKFCFIKAVYGFDQSLKFIYLKPGIYLHEF